MPALNDKSSEVEITEAVDGLVLAWPGVATAKMFGSRAFRAKGVLFAMIGGKGLILTKLNPQQREEASSAHHAQAFVGRGKVVPAWTEFPLAASSDLDPLLTLVRNAYENAMSEAD